MKTILALDISSRITGYSVIKDGKPIKKYCGIFTLNSKHSHGQRLQSFERQVKQLIHKHSPDIIVIEDIFKGPSALVFKILSLFRGVAIKAIYDETDRDPISLMASSARSLIGVKNTKEEAFDYIIKKYSFSKYTFKDNNDITDAIILGLAAHEMEKQGLSEKDLKTKKKRRRRKKKK